MEVFLQLNGFEIVAEIGEQERTMLDLAAGRFSREDLTRWLRRHVQPR
jgi:death on curing protein